MCCVSRADDRLTFSLLFLFAEWVFSSQSFLNPFLNLLPSSPRPDTAPKFITSREAHSRMLSLKIKTGVGKYDRRIRSHDEKKLYCQGFLSSTGNVGDKCQMLFAKSMNAHVNQLNTQYCNNKRDFFYVKTVHVLMGGNDLFF
jgi:hypothetical protein